MHQKEVRDPVLGPSGATAAFADVNPLAFGSAIGEQRTARQIVIDHHVGVREPVATADGDEFRISGTGANDGYVTWGNAHDLFGCKATNRWTFVK
jgi:hypothetical protein